MGKGGGGAPPPSGASKQAERLAKIQGDIGQGLFRQTEPVRGALIEKALTGLEGIDDLQGPVDLQDVTANPAFGALKSATEQQFDRARESAIGNTPRGGTLASALAGIETDRARANTQVVGSLAGAEAARRERGVDRALQQGNILGAGQTGQAISALSSGASGSNQAANTQAQLANAQANRDAGKAQGAGQAAGQLGSAAIKKCSRALKDVIAEVDGTRVLEAFADLDVSRWRYNEYVRLDGDGAVHVSPMAEDFQRLFDVGDGKTIDMIDAFGVLAVAMSTLARERRTEG